MVVDFGKAEVLKGQVAQALDGFIGRQFFLSHLLKQLAQSLRVHKHLKLDLCTLQFGSQMAAARNVAPTRSVN